MHFVELELVRSVAFTQVRLLCNIFCKESLLNKNTIRLNEIGEGVNSCWIRKYTISAFPTQDIQIMLLKTHFYFFFDLIRVFIQCVTFKIQLHFKWVLSMPVKIHSLTWYAWYVDGLHGHVCSKMHDLVWQLCWVQILFSHNEVYIDLNIYIYSMSHFNMCVSWLTMSMYQSSQPY